MAFAIFRTKKLHAKSLPRSAKHNARKQLTPNADPEKDIKFLLGSEKDNIQTLVYEKIGKQTIRKNGVLAVEVLLTASPEFFRPLDKSEAGYWQKDKVNAFVDSSLTWLKERYGKNLVHVYLHLDECTPHIHAYFVPLVPHPKYEQGKLNCREILGGRDKMRQLQDDYAKAVQHLGLERGIKGSKATHTKIKEFYSAIYQQPDVSLSQQEIQHQLADRKRILKENTELKRTLKHLSKQIEIKDKKIVELETGEKALEQINQHLQGKVQKQLDGINLPTMTDAAIAFGLTPIEGKLNHYRIEDKVFIITQTGFRVVNSSVTRESTNPIDLAMNVTSSSFPEAIVLLSNQFGEEVARYAANEWTREMLQVAPKPKFKKPINDVEKWPIVRTNLISDSKLNPQLIDKLHREGLIYADCEQNLVCLCRNLNRDDASTESLSAEFTGAILSSTHRANKTASDKFISYAPTSKRTQGYFYFVIGGNSSNSKGTKTNNLPARVVLVDTPFDALAKATLDNPTQKTVFIALCGNKAPYELLRPMSKDSVVIALNKNSDKENLIHQIHQKLPNQTVLKPSNCIDWILELEKVNEQKQQQLELDLNQSQFTPNYGITGGLG